MCNFFSLKSDGRGNIFYFTPEQRIAGVLDKKGKPYKYDSHASIEENFLTAPTMLTTMRKPDLTNDYEWNPFTDELRMDTQRTADDSALVLAAVHQINLTAIAGFVQGARQFIAGLKTLKWLDNHGEIPDRVKLFDTRAAAWDAARDAAWDAAGDAARDAAWDAAGDAAGDAAWDAARDAARDAAGAAAWAAAMDAAWAAAWDAAGDAAGAAARDAAGDAAGDAALYTYITYVCDGLTIDQRHIDHVKARWAVWEAGYGVACDVNCVLYCYKSV